MSINITIPSNPVDLKRIQDAVKEAEVCLIKISSEKDQIKSIIDDLNESYPDIDKRFFRKMIMTFYKQNLDQVVADNEDLANLYESVVAAK